MQTYLVGGAVRDKLLGRPVADRDYVVVGATPEEMARLGFRPIGRDFPVFLHPDTREEYALARTERKSGRGYHGFVFSTDPVVTLEQDLERRDLTINAMAEDDDGTPRRSVRRRARSRGARAAPCVARVRRGSRARAARRAFRRALCAARIPHRRRDARADAAHGRRRRSRASRRRARLGRNAQGARPSRNLRRSSQRCARAARCAILFPEIDALYGVPQRAEFHPEIDTGVHVELVLDMAARLAPGDDLVGWCALTHDLGKALTPADVLPRHIGHEQAGVAPLRALAARLRVPAEHAALAELSAVSISTCIARSSCAPRRCSKCSNASTRSGARSGSSRFLHRVRSRQARTARVAPNRPIRRRVRARGACGRGRGRCARIRRAGT